MTSSFEGGGVTLWQRTHPLYGRSHREGRGEGRKMWCFHKTIAYDFKY